MLALSVLKDVKTLEKQIQEYAKEVYARITGFPSEVRNDTKKRTGIWVLVGEPDSRNFVKFKVSRPSDAANHFCSEKAVRSSGRGEASSTNSRDPHRSRFSGSITVEVLICQSENEYMDLQCSISGLMEPEDTAGAIMILAELLCVSCQEICENVHDQGGELPEEITQNGHYLNDLLFAV